MKNTSDWVKEVIQSSKPADALADALVINNKPFKKFSDKYLDSSSSSSDSDSIPSAPKPGANIRSLKFELSTNSFLNKIPASNVTSSQPLAVQKQQLHANQIIEGLESAANHAEDDFWDKVSSSDSEDSSFGDTESEVSMSRRSSNRVHTNVNAAKPLEAKIGGVKGVAMNERNSVASMKAKENKPMIAQPQFTFDIKLEDLKGRDSRVSNVSDSKAQIPKLSIPTFVDSQVNESKDSIGVKKSLPADSTKVTALNFRFPKEPQSVSFQPPQASVQSSSNLPSIARPKIGASSQLKQEEYKISLAMMSPENISPISHKSNGVSQPAGKFILSPTAIDMAGKYITSELSSSSEEEPSVRTSNVHLGGLPGLPGIRHEESQERQLSIDIRPEESENESKISIPKLPTNIKSLAAYSKQQNVREFPKIPSDSEAESLESSSDISRTEQVNTVSLQLGSPGVFLSPKPPRSPSAAPPKINIQMPMSSPPQTDEIHVKPNQENEDSSRYSEIRTSIAIQSHGDILNMDEAFSILYSEDLSSEIKKIAKQIDKSSKGGCFGCFSGKSNSLVNKAEKDVRNRILALSLVKFNDGNSFHTRMLMSIWRGTTGALINCPRTGEQWKVIGFKTQDPAQELDSGVLGLFLMLFFCNIFTPDAKKMVERSKHPQLGYRFASIAIAMAKVTLSASKERKLNAIINKRNPANEVILFFYAGLIIQWFLSCLSENFDEARGIEYIKEVEIYAKKHPDEILMLAKSRLNQIRQAK
jgi:hypothetical protein